MSWLKRYWRALTTPYFNPAIFDYKRWLRSRK